MLNMIDRQQLRTWVIRLTSTVRVNNEYATQEVMKVAKEMDQVYLNMLSDSEDE